MKYWKIYVSEMNITYKEKISHDNMIIDNSSTGFDTDAVQKIKGPKNPGAVYVKVKSSCHFSLISSEIMHVGVWVGALPKLLVYL